MTATLYRYHFPPPVRDARSLLDAVGDGTVGVPVREHGRPYPAAVPG